METAEPIIAIRKSYEYRVVLTVRGNLNLLIRFTGEAFHEIHFTEGRRVTLNGTFAACASPKKCTFCVEIEGEDELTLHCVSLMLTDDHVLNVRRADAVATLEALKPATVRFPGGCYAEKWDWKTGQMHPDARPPVDTLDGQLVAPDTYYQELKDFENLEECLFAPEKIILPRLVAMREDLRSAGGKFSDMPIVLDEWNYQWGRKAHAAMALSTASLFGMLIRDTEKLGIEQALFFHPVNEGLMRVEENNVYPDEAGLIWNMYVQYAERQITSGYVEADSPDVDMLETVCGEDIRITVLNRNILKPLNITLNGEMTQFTAEGFYLDGKEPFVHSGLKAFAPRKEQNQIVLPPASVISLHFIKK